MEEVGVPEREALDIELENPEILLSASEDARPEEVACCLVARRRHLAG